MMAANMMGAYPIGRFAPHIFGAAMFWAPARDHHSERRAMNATADRQEACFKITSNKIELGCAKAVMFALIRCCTHQAAGSIPYHTVSTFPSCMLKPPFGGDESQQSGTEAMQYIGH